MIQIGAVYSTVGSKKRLDKMNFILHREVMSLELRDEVTAEIIKFSLCIHDMRARVRVVFNITS